MLLELSVTAFELTPPKRCPGHWVLTVAGKTLLDDMKKRGETLTSKHPKSERVQPCKTQYMRLCKLYVEVMKEHQRAKVRGSRS